MTPDAIFIECYTYVPLHRTEGLKRLLTAFEQIPEFTPTRWGEDERARIPYDRDEVIEHVNKIPGEFNNPGLHRRKPPRYEASFAARSQGLSYVYIRFDPAPDHRYLEQIFQLGELLANYLHPELAWGHPVWRIGDNGQFYAAAGILSYQELQKYGPKIICARTWYGRHLVSLIGKDTLASSGVLRSEMPWDGVQLDLVEKPWQASFEELSSRQHQVMQHLLPTGVYGDYSDSIRPKIAPRWVPFYEPPMSPGDLYDPNRKPMTPEEKFLRQMGERFIHDEDNLKSINISGMNLQRADLTEIRIEGLQAAYTALDYALVTAASLPEANFDGATLDGAHMDGVNLAMASIKNASLRGVSLQRALLTQSFCNNSDFEDADLTKAELTDVAWIKSRFDNAVFKDAIAEDAFFKESSFRNTNLISGNFRRANFSGADLTGANFRGADCRQADFRGATLENVVFDNTHLDEAIFDANFKLKM